MSSACLHEEEAVFYSDTSEESGRLKSSCGLVLKGLFISGLFKKVEKSQEKVECYP